jgi:hypothetical protein
MEIMVKNSIPHFGSKTAAQVKDRIEFDFDFTGIPVDYKENASVHLTFIAICGSEMERNINGIFNTLSLHLDSRTYYSLLLPPPHLSPPP